MTKLIQQQLAAIHARRPLTTDELAALLSIRPQSIRKRLCETGSYFAVQPAKMPNGRLLWPANAIELLATGA